MPNLESMDPSIFHFLDQFSLPTIFLSVLLIQVISIELGYYFGTHSQAKVSKAQPSQVRSIMGAGLGLLAFMLAFTFASSQDHYETRVQTMVDETKLIRSAYLQADFLPKPHDDEARALLRDYAKDRLEAENALRVGDMQNILRVVQRSEHMQQQLWDIATNLRAVPAGNDAQKGMQNEFPQTILALIDIHVARIEATALNRIPSVLWIALVLMAVLSMLVMGYQAGLVGRRSPIATITLAIAFSTVIVLITDLDRPFNSLFHIDNHLVSKLVGQMERDFQ